MKISATFDYSATPQRVFAMLTDAEFQNRKCIATGALSHSVSISTEGDRTIIINHRQMPTDGFPDFVKSMVGATLAVTETQVWGPPSHDGGREGSIKVDLGSAPLDLVGVLSLAPAGQGSLESVDANLKAKIPLIGGKIEKAAAPAIESAIRVERETGQAWLRKAN